MLTWELSPGVQDQPKQCNGVLSCQLSISWTRTSVHVLQYHIYFAKYNALFWLLPLLELISQDYDPSASTSHLSTKNTGASQQAQLRLPFPPKPMASNNHGVYCRPKRWFSGSKHLLPGLVTQSSTPGTQSGKRKLTPPSDLWPLYEHHGTRPLPQTHIQQLITTLIN